MNTLGTPAFSSSHSKCLHGCNARSGLERSVGTIPCRDSQMLVYQRDDPLWDSGYATVHQWELCQVRMADSAGFANLAAQLRPVPPTSSEQTPYASA